MYSYTHTKICISKQSNFCCRTIKGQSLNQGLHLKELHKWSLLLNSSEQHVFYIPCLIYHVCLKIKGKSWCIVGYKWIGEAIGYSLTEMKENLTLGTIFGVMLPWRWCLTKVLAGVSQWWCLSLLPLDLEVSIQFLRGHGWLDPKR